MGNLGGFCLVGWKGSVKVWLLVWFRRGGAEVGTGRANYKLTNMALYTFFLYRYALWNK